MTCIVGVASGGRVVIGADSAGVAGMDLTVRADRKVFRNGPFIMGFTTSFRMGQLLAYRLDAPKRHPDDDIMRYMVTDFIDGVRTCLKNGGYAHRENEVERGGVFLVGYEGRLFKVEGDYQVGESVHGFDAAGCGESFALGSLWETASLDAAQRVEHALQAAERMSAGVSGPFFTEELLLPIIAAGARQ